MPVVRTSPVALGRWRTADDLHQVPESHLHPLPGPASELGENSFLGPAPQAPPRPELRAPDRRHPYLLHAGVRVRQPLHEPLPFQQEEVFRHRRLVHRQARGERRDVRAPAPLDIGEQAVLGHAQSAGAHDGVVKLRDGPRGHPEQRADALRADGNRGSRRQVIHDSRLEAARADLDEYPSKPSFSQDRRFFLRHFFASCKQAPRSSGLGEELGESELAELDGAGHQPASTEGHTPALRARDLGDQPVGVQPA